jgi:hypothetical protein
VFAQGNARDHHCVTFIVLSAKPTATASISRQVRRDIDDLETSCEQASSEGETEASSALDSHQARRLT